MFLRNHREMSRRPGQPQRLIQASATVAALVAAILPAGCAPANRHGDIPLGQWSGQGTFVYERWESKEGQSSEGDQASLTRDYSTTLIIKDGTLDGRNIIEIDIVSKRGALPGLHAGDETHLVIALTEAKRVSDSTVLYRMLGALLNPGADEKLALADDGPPVSASCTTSGGVTVLQLQYHANFVDTFRFHGRRVEKSGLWFDPDEGLLHWWEQLHARRS